MSDREDDRDRDVEDLFGDLDEFFAPIEDLPEEESPEEESPEEEAEEAGDGEAVSGRRGEERPEVDVPAEEPGEPTAEMTGADLRRLREAVEEGPEAFEEDLEPLEEEAPEEEALEEESPEEEAPEEEAPEEPVLIEEATMEGEAEPPAEGPEKGEEATPEQLEAAAAHFASGIEPEEVERDLLAELEGEGPEKAAPAEPPPAAGEGPTWREPAAEEEEEKDLEPPPARLTGEGRNLVAAIASAVILAGAAIALLGIGKGFFVVLAVIVVLVGQGELYAVLKTRGFQPATGLGLVAGAFIMFGAYMKERDAGAGEGAMLFGLALAMTLTVLWYMAAPAGSRKGTTANAAATMLGVVYVPFLVSFDLLLLAEPDHVGRNLVLTVVGLTVLYDVAAYAIGTLWGSRPLAPNISPRKSWEGAIGATFVLLLVALSIVPEISPFDAPPFNAPRAVGLALVIAVAAPIGDLVESAVKRDLGVKDMGSLLPGHGGVLDRIDAILFTAPAAYYYLRIIS